MVTLGVGVAEDKMQRLRLMLEMEPMGLDTHTKEGRTSNDLWFSA